MDTSFWGPSGHQLFHSIAYAYDVYDTYDETYDTYDDTYDETHDNHLISTFFKSIGHILPCIYCRRSYQQYYKECSLYHFLENVKEKNKKKNKCVSQWYYLVHNKINQKLRKQGFLHQDDPSFEEVLKKYKKHKKDKKCFIGWNFLYSVIYHYPHNGDELSKRRRDAYVNFFTLLSLFYPILSIRKKYQTYLEKYPFEKTIHSSLSMLKWFYRFEKEVNPNCCSFEKRCSKLEKYHVKKCVNKSCRK